MTINITPAQAEVVTALLTASKLRSERWLEESGAGKVRDHLEYITAIDEVLGEIQSQKEAAIEPHGDNNHDDEELLEL